MRTTTLNVGVIGLTVDGAGWAAEGHAPAIRAVDGLALAGVATRSPDSVPLEDPATWTNLGTIQTAHTLDAVLTLAGSLDELHATLDIQYPEVTVDDGRTVTRTLPDHVLLSGRFASGATLSMEVLGGRPADRTPFRLEIFGDRGELTILGGAPRGFQAGLLSLRLSGEVQVDAEPGFPDLAPSAVNVTRVYEALRDDIVDGTTTAPTLDQAARLARLIENVGIGTAFTG